MKNAIAALLFAILAALGGEDTHAAAKTDEQRHCTDAARAKYAATGRTNDPQSHFTEHYNEGLKKCFMLIESTSTLGDDVAIFKTLINVSDGRQFGLWAKLGEGSDETANVRCTVTMLSGDEEPCFTEEQFRLLIKRYMQ
jgi:hypothetical protein